MCLDRPLGALYTVVSSIHEQKKNILIRSPKAFWFLFSPELQKNGIFPTGLQTPLTPGPPKKKQKVSHYKNNHHTPHKRTNNHIFFHNNHEVRGPAHKTSKNQQHESSGNVKFWKPKKTFPPSRDTPSKVIFDDADDFPRGGGKGEASEIKKKKKKKRPRKPKQVSSVPPEGHTDRRPDYPSWTGEMQRMESKPEKRRRQRRPQTMRTDGKKANRQMYPTDENLFIIKQRRRHR